MSALVDCRLCAMVEDESNVPGGYLFIDELWLVRHSAVPYGVAGWLTVQSIRHVAEPADFNDVEAASFGPMLCRFERVLRDVTGALRIYTVAMNESVAHFHVHMVPRYEYTPGNVSGFAIFDLVRLAAKGTVRVDAKDVDRICGDFKRRAAG